MAKHINHRRVTQAELEAQIALRQRALANTVTAIVDTLHQNATDVVVRAETGIDTVTDTLEKNIQQVTDRVQNKMTDIKNTLDVQAKVQATPFKMVGFAALAGAALGFLLSPSNRKSSASTAGGDASNQSVAGPAALIGLGVSLVRPLLVEAARDYVARKLNPEHEASGGAGAGGSYQNSNIYHSY